MNDKQKESKWDNPEVFPRTYEFISEWQHEFENVPGIDLLTYTAIKAMQGIVALAEINSERYRVNGPYLDVNLIAEEAFDMAEAMLRERSKRI